MSSVMSGCKVASAVAPASERRENGMHLVNPQPIWTIPSYMFSVHQNAVNSAQRPEDRYRAGVDNLGYYDSEVGLSLPAVHGIAKNENGGTTRCLSSRPSPAKLRKRPFMRFWELRFQQNEKPPPPRRTVALLVILIVTLLIVVVGVALLTYWLITQGLQGFYSEPREDGGSHIIDGQFHLINRKYSEDLADSSSTSFISLSDEITKSLDELFLQSAIVKSYNFSQVTKYSPREDSLVVHCRIILKHPLPNAVQEIGLSFIQGLERFHGRLSGEKLHVDIRSIRFTAWREEMLPHEQQNPGNHNVVPSKSSPPSNSGQASWAMWGEWSHCIGPNGVCNPRKYQSRSRKCQIHGDGSQPAQEADSSVCRKNGGEEMEIQDCRCIVGPQPPPIYPPRPPMGPPQFTPPMHVTTEEASESPETSTMDMHTTHHMEPTRSTPSVEKSDSHTEGTNTDDDASSQKPTTTMIPTKANTEDVTTQSTMTTTDFIDDETETISITGLLTHQDYRNRQNTEKYSSEAPHSSCQDCPESGGICLLLSGKEKPLCLVPRDPQDPRGCGGWCSGKHELCRALDNNTFQCVDDSECLPGEWRCMNGLCIPEERRCDGHFNCFDMSDETMCECPEGYYQCGNQTSCLPASKRCDRNVDCWDGSDEANCTVACPLTEFACNNGQCIAKDYFCDGYADCNDKSDEPEGCDTPCVHNQRKCQNGRCIDVQRWCDGVDTCGDNSDEESCNATVKDKLQASEIESAQRNTTISDYVVDDTVAPTASENTATPKLATQTNNELARTSVTYTTTLKMRSSNNLPNPTSPLPMRVWKET